MKIPFLDRAPRVALIRLQGLIAARSDPFGGGINAASVAPLIERVFTMKRIAAVFIAINSPGGSPVQSSLIAQAVRRGAEKKKVPVVALAEDAAASGGYWIACAADEIVCDPASILGSIGVVSSGFGFQDAIARLGIERRLRTAGTEKAMLDPFRPERAEDATRLQDLLDRLHEEFRAWVRSRRGDRFKADEQSLFTGRFWTGREAVALGLADRLGDVQSEAKRRFGEDVRVIPVGRRRRPFPWRLLPGVDEAAGALALVAEERAAWARIGM